MAHSVSGDVRVTNPGGRVDAGSSSGSIDVHGANGDVKAHTSAGRLTVQGNPSGNSLLGIENCLRHCAHRGPFQLQASHFSANAVSGQIRAQIPIVIEEQGKHSLRAHMGNGGGRVEIHTVSGEH